MPIVTLNSPEGNAMLEAWLEGSYACRVLTLVSVYARGL